MNYFEMTVDELQEYADKNNIDLNGAKRKASIIRAIEAASSKGEDEVELVDKDNELDPTVEAVPEPEEVPTEGATTEPEEAPTEDAPTEPEEAPTEDAPTEPEEAPASDAPKSMKIRALKGGLVVGGHILSEGGVYAVSESAYNVSAEEQKKVYGVVYYEKA